MSTLTARRTVRVEHDAEQAARDAHPELAAAPVGVLLRAGLALLAGTPEAEAISQARRKPGPAPRIRT